MNAYCQFMDRQVLSQTAHAGLIALPTGGERPARKRTPRMVYRMAYGSMAAALLVAMGLGAFRLWGGSGQGPVGPEPSKIVLASPDVEDKNHSFVAQGPSDGSKMAFPDIHGVDYADVTYQPEIAADILRDPGSFNVELTKEDILKIFWGPEGKRGANHFKMDTGDFPGVFLMHWAGYEISGVALYDGDGALWQLNIYGEKGEDSFTLRAAPGRIPPTCVVEEGAYVTRVIDTDVSAWYRSVDRDGDGEIEHIVTSEFLVNGVGFRFENVGSGGLQAGVDEANDFDGAILFNAMVVNHLCRYDGTVYLDHIAQAENIPAWRLEQFESLEQARQEEAFAPYLPQGEPVSFGAPSGFGNFEGTLSYHEGAYNSLAVRWYRNYDAIEVTVWLPEDPDGYPQNETPVDVNVPESYDYRLYDGPISDTVPREYQLDFYTPTFRAQDMSLEVVQARGTEKDTGGMAYRFRVLHENGVVVEYDCSRVSAEYVWSLVEATL